ncbi:ABC transporter permease [Abyssicoccus albus]|uniref:Oligopeptide transport system permease protein n=1 Tax=Abyssicoccus albus TaxID=1817405 RepID=A0A3N5BIF6_9BACL|nr:ABC transporter permease [Abyssicoccus albus]RPF57606.1 oligopeptide transport system permease protein [Abyssicoccus albus]
MFKYILKRIGYMFVTLYIIATITFFLMKLLPGSPFNDEKLSPEQRQILNERYGLGDPVFVQYLTYLKNIATGDFGVSFKYDGRDVLPLIMERLPVSAEVGIYAIFFGVIIGVILGVIAAVKQNSWIDYLATFISVLFVAVPSFVIGTYLQYFFGVEWEILPVAGWDGPLYIIMPAIALMCSPIATVARYIRAEMIEVLGSDYITLAKAKGNSTVSVLFKHALRNALIPIVTIVGPMAVFTLTGALTIEQIFAIPGMCDQFVNSIMTNDYPVIMALTMFFSILLVVILLVVDILYVIIDPRIRLDGDS